MKPADRNRTNALSQRIFDHVIRTTRGRELADLVEAQQLIARLDTGTAHWRALKVAVARRASRFERASSTTCQRWSWTS